MDRLGTTSRQTSTGGFTTATHTYDAFGMLVSSTGTFKGPFGFAGAHGYQEDADSGLQLLGHRYYDSSTGRFLTRDPAKFGRNWYSYCQNNPLKWVDPDGLEDKELQRLRRENERLRKENDRLKAERDAKELLDILGHYSDPEDHSRENGEFLIFIWENLIKPVGKTIRDSFGHFHKGPRKGHGFPPRSKPEEMPYPGSRVPGYRSTIIN